MRAAAVGLLVEEQRSEIAAAWKRTTDAELGGEPALGFAVSPLLREMAMDLREGPPSRASRSSGSSERAPGPGERERRFAVLVRSSASAPRVAREFKILHRVLWEVLRGAGRIVAADERRAADEWLDEALAAALDRLDRVRMRIDLLDRQAAAGPRQVDARAQRPPPLPRMRPPPLPAPGIIGPLGVE